MKIIFTLGCVAVALALLAWLELPIKPAAFPAFPQESGELETISLPEELPASVERFYCQV